MKNEDINKIITCFMLGDAFGVDYEFLARGKYNKPIQIKFKKWSDDTAMVLATLDVLKKRLNPEDIKNLNMFFKEFDLLNNLNIMIKDKENAVIYKEIMDNFSEWFQNPTSKFTTEGTVFFDIGITIRQMLNVYINLRREYEQDLLKNKDLSSIEIKEKTLNFINSYLKDVRKDENSCGNGSLMRILPLLYLFFPLKNYCQTYNFDLVKTHIGDNCEFVLNSDRYYEVMKFFMIKSLSSLTHNHAKTHLGCYIYLTFIEKWLEQIQDNDIKNRNNIKNIDIHKKTFYQIMNYIKEKINILLQDIQWILGNVKNKQVNNEDEDEDENKEKSLNLNSLKQIVSKDELSFYEKSFSLFNLCFNIKNESNGYSNNNLNFEWDFIEAEKVLEFYLDSLKKSLKDYESSKIFENNFLDLREDEIKTSGYVIETLKSVLWLFGNNHSLEYSLSLGDDVDTITALYYGLKPYNLEDCDDYYCEKIVKQLDLVPSNIIKQFNDFLIYK